MVETVSGTSDFRLPVDELMETALEGIGGEAVNHKEARMARTALNLLLIDLQNRGMAPLASLRQTQVVLQDNVGEYTLPANVFSVMDVALTVTDVNGRSTDLPINKMSHEDWLMLPKKTQRSRPTSVLIDKQRDGVHLRFWPLPDTTNSNQTYTFNAWCLNKINDVTSNYQLIDVPSAYLPAITMGLRFFMSFQRPGIQKVDRDDYKQLYIEMLDLALGEDRERVDFCLHPASTPQLRR